MAKISSFNSDRNFYADEHFPYGLNRSGEFTSVQSGLLIQHGCAYEAIANGSRAPSNDEEERFLAVCQGECPAESPHETVWQLYLAKISRGQPAVQSPKVPPPAGADDLSAGVVDLDI